MNMFGGLTGQRHWDMTQIIAYMRANGLYFQCPWCNGETTMTIKRDGRLLEQLICDNCFADTVKGLDAPNIGNKPITKRYSTIYRQTCEWCGYTTSAADAHPSTCIKCYRRLPRI